MNRSNDKLNSNRIHPDNSNNNTKVGVQSNRDKDQSRHNNAVVHEKRIIYFSKPLVNYDDDEEKEENSNKTKKNLGNRQSQNSQQVQ
ncbi:MAG TPA: hypothetical protein VJL78_03185, partial [Candidatus Nitrosocosmicus sp.]|nr:hypothetical protein [Candidatus Nitrosocosmicus sp.]